MFPKCVLLILYFLCRLRHLLIFRCRRGPYLFDKSVNLLSAIVRPCQPRPDPQTAGLKIQPANQKCDAKPQSQSLAPCVMLSGACRWYRDREKIVLACLAGRWVMDFFWGGMCDKPHAHHRFTVVSDGFWTLKIRQVRKSVPVAWTWIYRDTSVHFRVHTSEHAVIGEARFHRKEPEPTVSCWCQALYKEPLCHGKHKLTSQEAPEFSVNMRGLANNKVLSFCTYIPNIKRLTLSVGKRF